MQRHHQALAAPRTAHPQPRTSCLGTRRQGAPSLPRHRLPRRLRAVKMPGRLLSFGNRKVHTWLHPGRPTRWALPHPSPGPHVPVASGQVPGCPRLKTAFRRASFLLSCLVAVSSVPLEISPSLLVPSKEIHPQGLAFAFNVGVVGW